MVEQNVLGFFKEFQDYSKMERSLNATFVALIPKKPGAKNIKDFRPISLVGSMYSLLAKVLANILTSVREVSVRRAKCQRCGFGRKWQGWVEMCILTVRFSVLNLLINGSPLGFFASLRFKVRRPSIAFSVYFCHGYF